MTGSPGRPHRWDARLVSRWEARFREPGGGDRGPAEALAAARDLPDGEPRVTELERVTSAAETAGDLRTALDARFALIDAYLRQGERWRLFEPVRRCREVLDRLPELAGERGAELRRYQRFAVEAVFATPRVGLDQARSALDDLARSALDDLARSALDDLARDADGAHEASDLVAELRCRLADHLGDEPAARRWYDRWRTAPPDPATGCPGCAPSRRAELLAGWGEWAAALAELRSLLDDRPPVRPSHCTDQPEAALAAALLPLLRAGEPEQAARAHVEAYRRHRRERTAFPYLAAHLRFCALGGHLDRGLDILAEQLPRLDHPSDDMAVMEFSTAGALLCALATEAGRGDRRMPTPGADDGANGDTDSGTDSGTDDGANGDVDVARLGGLLAELATGLAGSFDARNGTGHQSGRIAARLAERPIAGPVSLPADEAGGDGDAAEPEDELDQDEPGALTINMITAALDRRGDAWTVRGPTVVGRWDPAVIEFRQAGERGEILHVRVLATRRLPAGRRAEAYAFCNVWNHDRLLPKAYAHDDDGELVLAGDVTCDLAHGVAPAQLDVLVTAAVTTGVAYAEAVAELP